MSKKQSSDDLTVSETSEAAATNPVLARQAVRAKTARAAGEAPVAPEKGERIAKYLARAGVCSRRDAERYIEAGRVSVDGKTLDSPALNITAANKVMVDGKPVQGKETTRLWRYHKPAGVVTTARDPQGRPTVFDNLPQALPRVVSIGRLDLTTEGLLLMTNDGALARYMELPKHAWERHYRVRVHGRVDEKKLAALVNGVTISGIHYGPVYAILEPTYTSNAWLKVSIKEGKNREVRKIMEHLGLQVTRLIRVAFGPFQLGSMPLGMVEEIPMRVLKTQIPEFFVSEND
jgi:23S rRNA pseudouridine2605 synthase